MHDADCGFAIGVYEFGLPMAYAVLDWRGLSAERWPSASKRNHRAAAPARAAQTNCGATARRRRKKL
eukprot:6175456-Pleurochrysis_carterae.AAC.4